MRKLIDQQEVQVIELKPNCLYSRPDLATMLEPAGVDVVTFIARLRPRRVFKMLWMGEDIPAPLRPPSICCQSQHGLPAACDMLTEMDTVKAGDTARIDTQCQI